MANMFDKPPEHLHTQHSGTRARSFPRISRPVELLRPTYDVVVVGSGYGGGVAASRMARGRKSVCVLERGREHWPGEYPSSLNEVQSEFHIAGDFAPLGLNGLHVETGDPTGLYHLMLGAGQNAFVGNGLGGTSLVNANVFLRADDATLGMEEWPSEIRQYGSLDKYYNRAEDVLQPEPYPSELPAPHKLETLRAQAKLLGLEHRFSCPPQTTRFKTGPNSAGVQMRTSGLTGQDCTGVNDGSKTTVLVTYLSDAWNWGAELFCECEVRYIQKHHTEGYIVYFAWHGCKRNKFKNSFHHDLMWVRAREFVFLGAGTIGTCEIMLRSKQFGLRMSDRVGKYLSGNGDILAFGYNMDRDANAIGRELPMPNRPVGPTITGMIDCRGQGNILDDFIIQEGATPGALAHLLQSLLETMPGSVHPANLTPTQRMCRFLSAWASRILGPYYSRGSLQRTQHYLIISRDTNQGSLTLKNGKPCLDFLGVGRTDHLAKLNALLAKITNDMGGTLIHNIFFATLNKQEITVHPIGGMNMSSDGTASNGATTHLGEVLTGNGSNYHDGLVVVDGAAISVSLAANPFATITALAERSVEGVAEKKGISIDYETRNGLLDPGSYPQYPIFHDQSPIKDAEGIIHDSADSESGGIVFTEVMKGFIHLGDDTDDFDVAAYKAESECTLARLFASVRIANTGKLESDPNHRGIVTGTFSNGLPGSPFLILHGDFKLFAKDPNTLDQSNLMYEFDMVGKNDEIVHFHGQKNVEPSIAFSPLRTWQATSTLYVTLTRLDGSLVGKGILRIDASDIFHELETLTPSGSGLLSRLQSGFNFVYFFACQVSRTFLAPFSKLQYPSEKSTGDFPKIEAKEILTLTANDGVETLLRMWEPTTKHDGRVFDILFIPGASVDHQVFALSTIKTSAIEHFTAAGYRCWVLTPRFGITPVARAGFTAFDARLDILAALTSIRARASPPERIYVIAHCVGALAFSMGLMDGTIPTPWIRGITTSQVFLHPEPGLVNNLKGGLPYPLTSLYTALAGDWLGCSSSPHDTLFQRTLNQLLRFYPVGSTAEICSSAACHRLELVYGRLWNHRNLNEATHSQLHRFFNGISMKTLAHLVQCSQAKTVVDSSGENLVTDENLERLRGIPILLFSGKENVVWRAESTLTTYTVLREKFGVHGYERLQFEGRGHLDCWMSESAVEVFEEVRRRVDEVCGVTRMSETKEAEQVGVLEDTHCGDCPGAGSNFAFVERRQGSAASDASSMTVA